MEALESWLDQQLSTPLGALIGLLVAALTRLAIDAWRKRKRKPIRHRKKEA